MKELINFDEQFGQYIEKWMAENADKYENVDEMEAEVPELYLKWMHEDAAFLDGAEPAHYFDRYDDPEELLALMRRYLDENVPLPCLLYTSLLGLAPVVGRDGIPRIQTQHIPPQPHSRLIVAKVIISHGQGVQHAHLIGPALQHLL